MLQTIKISVMRNAGNRHGSASPAFALLGERVRAVAASAVSETWGFKLKPQVRVAKLNVTRCSLQFLPQGQEIVPMQCVDFNLNHFGT